MAQTKKSTQDYWSASFGQHGEVKPGVNQLEIGAAAQGGGAFERLPIGTSSGGTAVLVDLIGAESFSVSVGTITTLVSGTVAKVTNLAAGTVTKLEGGTLGVLAAGSVVITAGTIGDMDTVGTVGILTAGTVTNVASGSVVVTAATVGTLSAYPLISGEDQTNDVMKMEQQLSYSHYTIGSGTVKSAAGFLHAVTVNTLATAPITIYDAVGTAAGTIATLKASAAEQTYLYDVKCPTGITIASTTAAVCSVTVAYR